ncbi:MAG TPA: hypothetical protein VHM24_02940, partial [Gemmatimonadaceae bacterium]|nr:hypothetical protein [Gemmatimonadaceae bacterium]
ASRFQGTPSAVAAITDVKAVAVGHAAMRAGSGARHIHNEMNFDVHQLGLQRRSLTINSGIGRKVANYEDGILS